MEKNDSINYLFLFLCLLLLGFVYLNNRIVDENREKQKASYHKQSPVQKEYREGGFGR